MFQGILIGIAAGFGLYAVASLVKGITYLSWPAQAPEINKVEARHDEPAREKSRPSPEKVPKGKQWYLVETKQGNLMLVQALKKTPKTVAGPFPTKQAAIDAKKRGETTSSMHVH